MIEENDIFAALTGFYGEKAKLYEEKCPLPGTAKFDCFKIMFAILQNVGLCYVNSNYTQKEVDSFLMFLAKLYKTSFNARLTDLDYNNRYGSLMGFVEGKIKPKIDFFEQILKDASDPNMGFLMQPFLSIYNDDVRYFANLFGNYIFYPNITVSNQKTIKSPYEKCKKEFTEFVTGQIAIDMIYNLLALLDTLYED